MKQAFFLALTLLATACSGAEAQVDNTDPGASSALRVADDSCGSSEAEKLGSIQNAKARITFSIDGLNTSHERTLANIVIQGQNKSTTKLDELEMVRRERNVFDLRQPSKCTKSCTDRDKSLPVHAQIVRESGVFTLKGLDQKPAVFFPGEGIDLDCESGALELLDQMTIVSADGTTEDQGWGR